MTEYLAIAALVGAGLNAGVFFSFSTFTMSGLKRLSPAAGAAAMQEINREAPRAPLMSLFFGTAILSVALIVSVAGDLDEVAARYQVAAGALFLAGVIMLTGLYHVPRNNKLDRLDPASSQGQRYWEIYSRQWVRMNHVRTVAPAAAAVLLGLSLVVG
jgi:uncharacterized membrane protein